MPSQVEARAYRIQDGCHNCRHCFVHVPYDDPIYYFCTLHQPDPPVSPPNLDEADFDEDSPS